MARLTPVPELLALAEAQHGVIARYQILRSYSPSAADDLLRTGWFERVVRGVYRVRGGGQLDEQRAFAIALRARPRATISGPLALGLIGVPSFRASAPFEILTAPGRWLTGVDVRHRVDPLPDRAVATRGEVRIAGPLHALLDSAAFVGEVSERDLRLAWDHLRSRGLITGDRLRHGCDELRDLLPGVRVLERVLDRGGGPDVESEGERALAPVLDCFDPPFERQVWISPSRRVDFLSRRCRYGYEYLGEVDHAYVAGRLADDARDAEVRAEGIRLGYVTKQDLREPQALLATIAGTLTVRAHELGVEPPVAKRRLG
ncbi:MAG: hypothetical protein WEB09_01020 [Nitriliruptor sp.]